jgi:LysM repeat protein
VSSSLPARASAVAAAVVIGLTVVACSDDSTDSADAGSTSVAIDETTVAVGSTYTVDAGDTLSGIAASYGLTLDELIAANGWTDGAEHAIFPGDVVELPAGAVAVSTTRPTATATTRPASSGATATTSTQPASAPTDGGYRDTGLPFAGPDRGTTDPIVQPLPDGVYFADSPQITGGGTAIEFTLWQRFTGDDCLQQFTTAPLNCIGDGFTGNEATRASMIVSDGTATVIGLDDTGNPVAYEVSPDELVRLISGETPADDAPEGFSYAPYPFIVTVRGGEIVAADQQFQS